MSQADRKLRRAQTLLRNTPSRTRKQADQTEARIMMKRESIRGHGRDSRTAHETRPPISH